MTFYCERNQRLLTNSRCITVMYFVFKMNVHIPQHQHHHLSRKHERTLHTVCSVAEALARELMPQLASSQFVNFWWLYRYNMAEVPAASASSSSASSSSSSGKCKGGYRASRGKKVGKSSISSNLSANSGATSSAVIAAVVVAVVIVAAGLLVLQRRVSRRDVGQKWQHADAAAQHSHAQTVVMYEA